MTIYKKIWYLLTSGQRKRTVVLLGLMVISMLLETLGVGLILPAMTLLTQDDLPMKYPFLRSVFSKLGNPDHERLVIYGMLVLVMIYLVKALFLTFLAWIKAAFYFGVQVTLSTRLFEGYLRQPYTFHLQRNSAQLIRNIITETNLFTFNSLISSVMLITESLVLLGIVTLLVYIEPMGAIFVAVTLGTVGAMIHMVTKTRILQWGKARQLHEGLRLQHLQQGLGGVKDVKLLGREEEFLAQYHVHNLGSAAVGRRQNIMQALPLLWFELLGVFSLATLMITMIIEGKPVAVCVSALSVFAVAAFRIMPAMNRIVMSVQNLRYSLPVTNILYSEVHQLETSSTNREHKIPMPFKRELELFNVGYTYPSASGIAIEAINLIINKGSSVAFVGESGAGKSTLVDLILGLLTPDQGSIRIDGVNIHSNIRAWQEQIGYVPQTIYLSDDSICRNIAFGVPSSQIDVAAVNRALKAAQLDEFIASLPDGLNTLVGERGVRLSGGQCQRIGIARALYHNPSVLVLDEATSALDLATEAGVMEAVYALKGDRTLIIIAHRLSTVQQCDRVISMDHGKLIEEQVLDLRAKQATDNTKSEWKEHA